MLAVRLRPGMSEGGEEMIEAEARKKWCPMVRASASQDDSNSCNREIRREYEGNVLKAPFYSLCITSECMMWRGTGDVKIDGELHHTGYCGLGGKP